MKLFRNELIGRGGHYKKADNKHIAYKGERMQNEKEMFVSIVQKVHKAGGDEALERFLLSNGEDCPPIKLTPQEMEFLKGGGFFGWIKRNIIDPVVGFIKDNKDLIDAVKTVASVAAVI